MRRARALADHVSQNQHRAEQRRLVRLVVQPLQREKVDDDVCCLIGRLNVGIGEIGTWRELCDQERLRRLTVRQSGKV